jgi:putative tryptophan/tyrosine transport system substrate-binding protein
MKHSKSTFVLMTLLFSLILGTSSAQDAQKNYIIGNLILVGDVGLKAQMTELGYVEGENVTYHTLAFSDIPFEKWQEEYPKRVQAMVEAGVELFVVNTDTDAVYLQTLVGKDVPIVFARSDDPVATGAVADLINPGGSITGIITNRPHERRLQILTEIKPSTKKIYYLYSPLTLEAEVVLQQVRDLAEELEVEVVTAQISDPVSGAEALDNMPEDVDWIFMTPFVFFDPDNQTKLLDLSVEHRAGITGVTDTPFPGYLMGYGPGLDATGEQAALIVDRILRGASPADLPVQTAENYLLINLEAAEAIKLDIPVSILRQADTIVRPGFFDELSNAGN